MLKLLTVAVLLLLVGSCRATVGPLQEISADLRYVSPGENITLHCSVSADYEISWYLQNSEEQMKLLVSAGRGKLNKLFSLIFNINEDHYDIVGNSSSVSLVIIGVNETDLGLYYCGGRNYRSLLHFGKPIKLTFTDVEVQTDNSTALPDAERSAGSGSSWIIILILTCVCVVQMTIICLCVIYNRVQGQRCNDAGDSYNKELALQYAHLHHTAVTRGTVTTVIFKALNKNKHTSTTDH